MPPVSRLTDITFTGHTCIATVPLSVVKQTTVFASMMPIARIGDTTIVHPFPPKPPCKPHLAGVNKGDKSVLTVGIPTATIGKSCDLGVLKTGAPTVLVGGPAGGGSQKAADGSRNALGQQTGGGAAQGFAPPV